MQWLSRLLLSLAHLEWGRDKPGEQDAEVLRVQLVKAHQDAEASKDRAEDDAHLCIKLEFHASLALF